ncbi:hypothetical protein FI667_g16713, partial [Globisporangium splendens]
MTPAIGVSMIGSSCWKRITRRKLLGRSPLWRIGLPLANAARCGREQAVRALAYFGIAHVACDTRNAIFWTPKNERTQTNGTNESASNKSDVTRSYHRQQYLPLDTERSARPTGNEVAGSAAELKCLMALKSATVAWLTRILDYCMQTCDDDAGGEPHQIVYH